MAFKTGAITADIELNANPALEAMRKAKAEAVSFTQEGKRASSVLTKAMDDAKAAAVGYDKALHAGREALNKLNADVDAFGKKKLEITKRIGEFHGWIEKSKQSVSELQQKIEQSGKTKTSLGDIYKQLDKEIANSRKNIDELTARLRIQREMLAKPAAGQDNNALKQSIKETTAELNAMKRALNFQETNRGTVQRGLKAVDAEAKQASVSVKKLDRDMQFHTGQIDRAEGEMRQLDRQIEATVIDAKHLKTELNEIALAGVNARANTPGTLKSAGLGLLSMAKADAVAYGAGFFAVGAAAEVMRRTVVASVSASIQAFSDLEVAQVEMAKTVDGTKEELAAMTQEIVDISLQTPFSANALLRGAGAGGQLGIAKENLVDFALTMEKIAIASDLTAEAAGTGFAQWANITGMAQEKIANLANVVVDLGQNSAATEQGILGMGMRLASAGDQAGLLDEQTMALAATLKSLGLEEEVGGTAFSRILGDISKSVATGGEQLDLYAQISRKTKEQFVQDWRRDAAGALADFLSGMQAFRDSGGNMFQLADQLGFDDMRVGDALRRAAGGAGLFAEMLGRANIAIKDTAALDSEAAKFSATFASSVATLNNAFTDLKATLAGGFSDDLKDITATIASLIRSASEIEKSSGAISNFALAPFRDGGGVGGFLGAILRSEAEYASNLISLDEIKQRLVDLATAHLPQLGQVSGDTFQDFRKEATLADFALQEMTKSVQDMFSEQDRAEVDAQRAALSALKKEGESLWKTLSSGGASIESAVERVKALELAGHVDQSAASLLSEKIWKDLGTTASQEVDKAIKAVRGLSGEFAESIAKGLEWQKTVSQEDDLMKAFGLDKEVFSEWRDAQREAEQQAEKKAQALDSLLNRIDPFSAAMNQLQDDMDALTDAGRFQMFTALAEDFFAQHKDAPGIIAAAINAFQAEAIQMDELGLAAMALKTRLEDLRAEQIANTEASMTKNEALERGGFREEDKKEKDKYNIKAMEEAAGALRTLSALADGLGDDFHSMSTAFKVASIGINTFAKISEIAAATTRMSWESALGIFGVILEAVYQLADAFGFLGKSGQKEAKGIDKVWKEFGDSLDNMLDGLAEQIVDGEADFREFAQNAIKELNKIAITELLLQPIVGFGKDILFNAKGNAFSAGNVVPFAKGGVVTAPSMFPMADGRKGLMGEAGPEAVMPLERMPGGKLGVNAAFAGGGAVVNINDYRSADSPPVRVERSVRGGVETVDVYIERVVEGAINRGRFDRPLERSHGLRRRGA